MDKEIPKNDTQYLFFILENEEYAMNASYVQEIVDYTKITKVPKSNSCVKGITNIRGELIGVVDPKVRFGMEQSPVTKKTSFIITKLMNKEKESFISIALVVDMVIEVEDIKTEDILPSPEFGMKIDKRFIKNVIRRGDTYISVLDMENVLNIKELSQTLQG